MLLNTTAQVHSVPRLNANYLQAMFRRAYKYIYHKGHKGFSRKTQRIHMR